MKLVIQRVSEARVSVNSTVVGAIGTGLLVLLGISKLDSPADADYLSDKVLGLRIFPDMDGKLNCDIRQADGAILIVSQFTLYGDCRKGRRPSFDAAAGAEQALDLYNYFVDAVRKGQVPVETGTFQAPMEVQLVNVGPVTILIDSAERNRK